MALDAADAIDVLASHGRRYRSKITVTAEPVTVVSIWASTTGDQLRARAGDWWVCDGADRWSVDGEIFARTYVRIGGDRYRKVAAVTAAVISEPLTVPTLEGVVSGSPGDYLVGNPGGDVWVIPAAVFTARYEQEQQ